MEHKAPTMLQGLGVYLSHKIGEGFIKHNLGLLIGQNARIGHGVGNIMYLSHQLKRSREVIAS